MGLYEARVEGVPERTQRKDVLLWERARDGLELQRFLCDHGRPHSTFLLYRSRRTPGLQMCLTLRADGMPAPSEQGRYPARQAEFGLTQEILVLLRVGRQLRTLTGAKCVLSTVGSARRFEVAPAAKEVLCRGASLASTSH
jgi:hypothetical protein